MIGGSEGLPFRLCDILDPPRATMCFVLFVCCFGPSPQNLVFGCYSVIAAFYHHILGAWSSRSRLSLALTSQVFLCCTLRKRCCKFSIGILLCVGRFMYLIIYCMIVFSLVEVIDICALYIFGNMIWVMLGLAIVEVCCWCFWWESFSDSAPCVFITQHNKLSPHEVAGQEKHTSWLGDYSKTETCLFPILYNDSAVEISTLSVWEWWKSMAMRRDSNGISGQRQDVIGLGHAIWSG
jgi:hypothetical protein